ncbi:hypothetical protein ACVWXM_001141 [Bradyrhizobium sp. GM7.3]
MADHGDVGADLAEVIGQHMDEAVVMVDQQYPLAASGGVGRKGRQRLRRIAAQRLEQGRGLDLAFAVLGGGIGVEQTGGADTHFREALLHPDGPDGEAGVDAAVEIHRPDRAGIPAAGRALVILDELHRPEFWCASDGDRPRRG